MLRCSGEGPLALLQDGGHAGLNEGGWNQVLLSEAVGFTLRRELALKWKSRLKIKTRCVQLLVLLNTSIVFQT